MKGGARQISSQLDGQMGTAGKRAGSRFGAALKSGLAAGVATAGAAAAVGLIKGAVAEAREAQKVGATTAQIIKSTGGAANVSAAGVAKLATSLSNKTGVDDEAIQTGSNLLLTFKNVRNEAGKGNKVFDQATAAAVDLSAAGFGSIDSASKMLGKALNDPIKGVTALSRAGVTFTQQQKDQIAAMVKSGDVLGAQKIILGEVKSQVGGVAAASATSGEKLKTTFNNFKESIGTALLPAIDAINNKLIGFFSFVSANRPVMIALGVVVGGILVGAFLALAVSVIAATWPFILAGVAVAALAAGFIYAYKNSSTFRTIVRALAAQVLLTGAAFLRLASMVVGAMAKVLGAIGKIPGDKFAWARNGAKELEGISQKLGVASTKTGEFAKKLTSVPKKTNADVKTSKLDKPVKDSKALGDNIKKIPASKKAGVTVSSLTKPIGDIGKLSKGIDQTKNKKVAVTMNSLSTPIKQANDLRTAIGNLKSKTITVTTRYETSGTPPRNASGSIVSGATRVIVGEAGPEAIVPLDRPLNMVDPSVRWLAAYAQGKTDLSSMQPMSLDSVSPSPTAGSNGPTPVVVTNAREMAGIAAVAVNSGIDAERQFAGTTGRMRKR